MQLACIAVRRRHEALRFDARKLQQSPAAPDDAARFLKRKPRELAARGRTSGERAQRCRTGPRARCRSPCWAISSPARRRSLEPVDERGRPLADRVHVACRTTSSVARSMPASSSQSRISAQRSTWAGSMPWTATARRRAPEPGVRSRRARRLPSARGPSARPVRPRAAHRSRPMLGSEGVARSETLHRRLPRASASCAQRARCDSLAQQRQRDELEQSVREGTGSAGAAARDAVLDQRHRPALGDRDDRQPARLSLEDHLSEGVGRAREEKHVGAGVGTRELVALEPAEEGRVRAEQLGERSRSGPPPASTRCSRSSSCAPAGTPGRAARPPSRG